MQRIHRKIRAFASTAGMIPAMPKCREIRESTRQARLIRMPETSQRLRAPHPFGLGSWACEVAVQALEPGGQTSRTMSWRLRSCGSLAADPNQSVPCSRKILESPSPKSKQSWRNSESLSGLSALAKRHHLQARSLPLEATTRTRSSDASKLQRTQRRLLWRRCKASCSNVRKTNKTSAVSNSKPKHEAERLRARRSVGPGVPLSRVPHPITKHRRLEKAKNARCTVHIS